MDIGPSHPLLRAARADGVYLFCAAIRGWTIRRDGKVIAIGDGDNKSIAEGIKRFIELTTPNNSSVAAER
jgi:hypothetical protein